MLSAAGVPYKTARDLFGVGGSYYSSLKSDAERILDVFASEEEIPDGIILITPQFVARCVTALLVICNVSVERIVEFFDEVFHYHISKGTIGNIQKKSSKKALGIDLRITLELIKYIALDEIFQQGQPVLTGVDLETQYVFMMEIAPDRTGDTWDRALSAKKANGLHPKLCVSDAGSGLQSGVPSAFQEITMQLDVFHALRDIGVHVMRRERAGFALLSELCTLENKVNRPKTHKKTIERYEKLSKTIDDTLLRTDTLCILYDWLKELTGFSGYGYEKSLTLCAWILDEMAPLFPESRKYQKAISSFRTRLPNILKFLSRLQENLMEAAISNHFDAYALMLLYNQKTYSIYSAEYAAIEKRLFQKLGDRILDARELLPGIIHMTYRASSIIENVNGRIRCYMNMKREIPKDFLILLKLYFNTRKAVRPANKQWAHTSALDRLTGCDHPSFLDMLFGPPNYLICA